MPVGNQHDDPVVFRFSSVPKCGVPDTKYDGDVQRVVG